MTQHIPDKGQHLVRYFGFYSNKQRGMRKKRALSAAPAMGGGESVETGTGTFMKQRCMSWAALIKKVYEVDPLRCPGPVLSLVAEPAEACRRMWGHDADHHFYREMSARGARKDSALLQVVERPALSLVAEHVEGMSYCGRLMN